MKKLLIGLGVVIVLIIAAAIIVPMLVPVGAYEGRLIALVKQTTGRNLTISGPVKLSLLPTLALEANDVALANAPGGRAPQMVRLKQLQVKLAVLPLLHGELEISRFALVQPVIALEVDKAGHPNWVFGPAAPAAGTPAAAAASSSGAGMPMAELSLQNVQIAEGKISYFDARTGKTAVLDGINMKLSLPSLDSPLQASGSAVWNGEKVSLSIDADRPRTLLAGGQSTVGIKLASNPVTLSFSGQVTGLPPAKATGTVDLAMPSLRDFAKWAGSPIAMGGSGLGPLKITGTVAMAGPKYSFNDANISLDDIQAKGAISVDTGGARPSLTGQLDVDKLDLNPYLPPPSAASSASSSGGAASGGGGAAQSSAWSDAPIDVSPLKVADIDFSLKAGAIVYRKFEIGPSALTVRLKNGKLAADLSQMALYQGSGHGTVTLDGSGAVPAIALNFNLAKVEIGPLAEAATGSDRLSGTGAFDIAVTGRGKSQRAIIGSLNGKGDLDLANGQIKGVNLLAMAENAVKNLAGGSSSGDATDFGTLTASYTITNGLLRNTDLQIKSGAVPMTGQGTVNLPTTQVDFRVAPQLPGGIGVPIAITGPWSDLSYHPDLSGIVQGAVKEPGKLLNSLKSGGENAGSGAGSLLKGLFGK